jgi:hypothetical protein
VILFAVLLVAVGVVIPMLVGAAATGVESSVAAWSGRRRNSQRLCRRSPLKSRPCRRRRGWPKAEDIGPGPAVEVRYLELEDYISVAGR